MKVSLYGVLQEVKTMADRSYKVVFRTNELPSEHAGILMGLVHEEGHCLFASEQLEEKDIPEGKPELKDEKSPSKRLKDRMFVYYTQHLNKPKEDFNLWYMRELERIGNVYLDKMN